MKVKVNDFKEKTTTFPVLMKSISNGRVYIMQNSNDGICLVGSTTQEHSAEKQVGLTYTGLRWRNLEPFNGEITLSNDR